MQRFVHLMRQFLCKKGFLRKASSLDPDAARYCKEALINKIGNCTGRAALYSRTPLDPADIRHAAIGNEMIGSLIRYFSWASVPRNAMLTS